MTEPINLPPEIDLATAYAQKDFSPITVHYEGEGVAQFEKLNGIARGKVSLDFNENGLYNVTMQIQSIESTNSLTGIFIVDFSLLLAGKVPPPLGESISWGVAEMMDNNNTCIRLNVNTPEGTFIVMHQIHYSPGFNRNGYSANLTFNFSQSYFLVGNSKVAKYWRVALTNFISDFANPQHDVTNHIARIPSYPSSNRLISFENENNYGFIEPLANYSKRKESLEKEQFRRLIMALMVGNMGIKSEQKFDIENNLPFKLLSLLSFATGTEVGTPWLELLDEEGKLVTRFHISYEVPIFFKGHTTVNELPYRGIGELLSKFQALSDHDHPNLRALIKHVVRKPYQIQTVEDNLAGYFRALDSLCKYYNLAKQENLSESLELDQQKVVKEALLEAKHKIIVEMDKANASGQKEQSRILQRISSRVENFDNKDQHFGLAVVALLKRFGFPDADVMDDYYISNPRPDKSKWDGVLSHYRGVTIHEGFFDFGNRTYDFEDVFNLMQHLHDITLRLILKIIGYSGTYNPAVPNDIPVQLVDWVKEGITTAKQLGYN